MGYDDPYAEGEPEELADSNTMNVFGFNDELNKDDRMIV